jgi:hypothetical protein
LSGDFEKLSAVCRVVRALGVEANLPRCFAETLSR